MAFLSFPIPSLCGPGTGLCDDGAMVDRRSLGMREMAVAIGVLAVSLLAVLAAMGLLGFGSSTDDAQAPTADVTAGLQRARTELGLPLLIPAGLPSNWQPNSFQQLDPKVQGGDRTLVRAGWLTGSGAFITLVQSTETPAVLVGNEVGQGLSSRGTAAGGGAQWSVFPGVRDEPVWVRTVGPLTVLITGSAGESDFQVLAASVASPG